MFVVFLISLKKCLSQSLFSFLLSWGLSLDRLNLYFVITIWTYHFVVRKEHWPVRKACAYSVWSRHHPWPYQLGNTFHVTKMSSVPRDCHSITTWARATHFTYTFTNLPRSIVYKCVQSKVMGIFHRWNFQIRTKIFGENFSWVYRLQVRRILLDKWHFEGLTGDPNEANWYTTQLTVQTQSRAM